MSRQNESGAKIVRLLTDPTSSCGAIKLERAWPDCCENRNLHEEWPAKHIWPRFQLALWSLQRKRIGQALSGEVVPVVHTAMPRHRSDLRIRRPLNRRFASNRGLLVQSEMSPVIMGIADVIRHQACEMMPV